MFNENGDISLLFKMVFWIVLMSLAEGADSSTACPGASNHVTASENYTEVNIRKSFSPYQSCTWVIESGTCSDIGVEVEIYSLNLIRQDSLTIYDGPSSKYPVIPLEGMRWDRIDNIPSKRSSGRFITVDFLFKQYHYERNLGLRYRNTPAGRNPSRTDNLPIENPVSDTCGEDILLAYQEPHFITSPGYPGEYDNAWNCKWTILSDDNCNNDVIQVTIHTLSLGGTDDDLIIYDGDSDGDPVLAKLSGQEEPQVITASGNAMVIKFRAEYTAPGQGFNVSYIRTRGIPLLAEIATINITEHTAVMAVNFTSSTAYRAVYWSKNGYTIHEDDKHTLTVTPESVSKESGVSLDVFRAMLEITEPDPADFGLYKVAVVNRFGFSERLIYLRRGNSVPIIQDHTVFPDNATIMVTFSSDTNFKIEWYKKHRLLTHRRSEANITTVQTEDKYNGEPNEAVFKSVLSRTPPTELYYGQYKCIIRNDIGSTEISIYMEFPETELPKLSISSPTVDIRDQEIILSVNFDSNIAYPSATWFIGDDQIASSEKHSIELTWEGVHSKDWTANGYPYLTDTDFVRVSIASSVIDDYAYMHYEPTYPTIGITRLMTQPRANYTAELTISNITPEDFGIYRVVLQNEAGISHHAIEIPTPEVFPYVTCDQAETTQLVCNVTSCSSVSLSWIHSVDGEIIRNLPGHQNGTINTLTIPVCMYSDAGTYTCIATDKENGNNVKLHHDRATLIVRAVPVILESTLAIQRDGIQLEVPFVSNPPHRWITWHRNGNPVGSSYGLVKETVARQVNLPMYSTVCSKAGNVTSLLVYNPSAGEFGMYKVTIGNEMGSSEHFLNVQNPLYANPVASSNFTVSMNGTSAILIVTFSSYYPYNSVKWYFRGNEIQENYPVNKYVIQTRSSDDDIDSSRLVLKKYSGSTVLTITSASDEDYGAYEVIVSNDAGQAVIPVMLSVHDEGIPKVVEQMTAAVSHSMGEISITFYSSPSYNLIRWLKQDNEITIDSSKYNIVNEDIHIEILIKGETVPKTGTKTRLRVMALNDEDYGLYSVQIHNHAGMTERSTTLEKECK